MKAVYFFVVLIIFVSCSVDQSISRCEIAEHQPSSVSIQDKDGTIVVSSLNTNVFIGNESSGNYISGVVNSGDIDELYIRFAEELHSQYDLEEFDITAIGLSINSSSHINYSADVMIDVGSVLGYAMYMYNSNFEDYLLISGSLNNTRCRVELFVPGITTNNLWEINDCVNRSKRGDQIILKVSDASRIHSTKPDLDRMKRLFSYKSVPDRTEICEFPCLKSEDMWCYEPVDTGDDLIPWCIRGTACGVEDAEGRVNHYEQLEEESFNNRLRNFRDIWLDKSTFSQNCVSHYYYLSENIDINELSYSLVLSTMVFSSKLDGKLELLIDYDGGNNNLKNQILYDNTFRDEATNLLDRYISELGGNPQTVHILNSIREDVIDYSNLTISEINENCCT